MTQSSHHLLNVEHSSPTSKGLWRPLGIRKQLRSKRHQSHAGGSNNAFAKEQKLVNKDKIMGFGHRVYKAYDPRATYLKTFAKGLAEARTQSHLPRGVPSQTTRFASSAPKSSLYTRKPP